MVILGYNMKNKKLISYIAVVIIIIVVFVFSDQVNNSKINSSVLNENIADPEIFHTPNSSGKPGKSNVNSEVLEKIESLKEAVTKDPKDTLTLKTYADILVGSHKTNEAKIAYLKILEIDPNRIDILENLTNICFTSGDYKSAAIYNDRILIINKNNKTAIYNAGAIAATTGNRVKAKDLWQKLINNFKGSEEANLAEKSLEKL